MRYRIFANTFLHYKGRQSFDEPLIGKDPKHPVGEVLNVLGQDYVVTNYHKCVGEKKYSANNEFHEIAKDWFTDVVEVKAIP